MHTCIHTYVHACIQLNAHTHERTLNFPGENSRHHLYSIRKSSNLETLAGQPRQRVYRILAFLPPCYNIIKLEIEFFNIITNYIEIVLCIQCSNITWYKTLMIYYCV